MSLRKKVAVAVVGAVVSTMVGLLAPSGLGIAQADVPLLNTNPIPGQPALGIGNF